MSRDSKGTSSFGILILILFAILAGLMFWMVNSTLEYQKDKIIQAMEYIKSDFEFARLKILNKSDEKTYFSLFLLNQDGKTILNKDFELSGNDIYLESKVVVIQYTDKEKAFVFPSRLYTEKIAPQDGIDLLPYYSQNDVPATYVEPNTDSGLSATIKNIFKTAFTNNENKTSLEKQSIKIVLNMDASLHQSAFQKFEKGKTYRCIVHPNGGLELMEVTE